MRKKAILCLADGSTYTGTMFGACKEVIGELVFNTGMTGYQEVLTDPSYGGQMVMLTYPTVWNYSTGIPESYSLKVHMKAFIVQDLCEVPGSQIEQLSLEGYLEKNGVTGLCNVDTRAITRKIREAGVMNAAITTEEVTEDLLRKIRNYRIKNPVDAATCEGAYFIPGTGPCVAVLDMGAKNSIVQTLLSYNCAMKVYPARTPAYKILEGGCDGVIITNGPGDPKDNDYAFSAIRELMENKYTMGIGLGHQMMALAHGGDTYKMPFGHRGANHPVKDQETGRIRITSQNHGYAVDGEKLPNGGTVLFKSVNDGSVEGMRYENGFSVQFNPDASPGPQDTRYLFKEFLSVVESRRK